MFQGMKLEMTIFPLQVIPSEVVLIHDPLLTTSSVELAPK
jgi:hypothetical protein